MITMRASDPQTVLKVSAFGLNTSLQSYAPLFNRINNNLVIKIVPFFNKTFPQVVNIVYLAVVNLFLQNTPTIV